MSQFVNYHKRGFTLPAGCKDLIDVLGSSRRKKKGSVTTGGIPVPSVQEHHYATGGMAQVGRYVSKLLQSRGEQFTLSIQAPCMPVPLTLYRRKGEQTGVIVLVTKEADREQAARAFFRQRGIASIWDYLEMDNPDVTPCLAHPLPVEAAQATSLITGLLWSVFGLTDETGLTFSFYEMETLD